MVIWPLPIAIVSASSRGTFSTFWCRYIRRGLREALAREHAINEPSDALRVCVVRVGLWQ